QVLNADGHLLRRYEKSPAQFLWLYVGYYGTEKGGRTGHLPQYCLPGAGYQIESLGKEWIQTAGGDEVRVNRLLARKNGEETLILYWIQSDGSRVVDSGVKMNINRFMR